MKIYSWNILYRNRELDRAFEFISHTDFDIFCLQEVPEGFLTQLTTLPFHIVSGRDAEKVFASDNTVSMYTVILSKHPITAHGEIPFTQTGRLPSLRVRLFTLLMRPFHFSFVRNRGGLYADVTMNGVSVRIFTLHLALTHPAQRLEEFERAMLTRAPGDPAIVCGDFNILEKPHITPLNWLMGGRLSDSLLFSRERTHIEEHFVAHELTNVLRGNSTHNLSRSQLDHILVSHSFSIKNSAVLPDSIGSDHHPIVVEIS